MDERQGHSWQTGKVDPQDEHFRLYHYCDSPSPNPMDKFEKQVSALARVGKGDGTTLIVQFLDDEHSFDASARAALEDELDFYIRKHKDDDKWAYPCLSRDKHRRLPLPLCSLGLLSLAANVVRPCRQP
jgi:hypothetical protein